MSGQLDDAAAQAAPPNAVAGPEGPAVQQSEAEVNWRERYDNLQPEYTRTTQENAELRRQAELYEVLVSTDDPDTRRMIAEQLGYQLDEEPEQAQDDEDPWAARDARLERIEAALSKRDEDERSAAYAAEVRRASDTKLEDLGIPKEDQDWVLAYAINALPATADGLPDIEGAHQVFAERETARQRDWARTKRAPYVSPNGQAATEVPNLDKHQDRVDWMVRRLEDGATT